MDNRVVQGGCIFVDQTPERSWHFSILWFWLGFWLNAWKKLCGEHKLKILHVLFYDIKYISSALLWFF